jgi:hypothetical protein
MSSLSLGSAAPYMSSLSLGSVLSRIKDVTVRAGISCTGSTMAETSKKVFDYLNLL